MEESREEEEEESWGVRACKGIAHLNGSLIRPAEMIRWQNDLLGHLMGMMEEERTVMAWRQQQEGTPVVAPVVDLSKDNEDEEEEVEEEAGNEGEGEEDLE